MAEAVRLVSLSNHKNGQFVTSASSVTASSVVNQIFQSESSVLQKGPSCTKATIQGNWYTKMPFPVQNPRFKALVHQMAFSCTKPTIQGGWYTRWPFPVQNPRFKAVGTPDGLFLYKIHDSRQLVHQNAFSCTNSNHQIKKRTKFLIIIKMNINFAML